MLIYLAAEASEAGAIAAGADASAAGATTTAAGAGATTTGAGAGASSFLPHATRAAAAITAANTSDLFIFRLPNEFVGKGVN